MLVTCGPAFSGGRGCPAIPGLGFGLNHTNRQASVVSGIGEGKVFGPRVPTRAWIWQIRSALVDLFSPDQLAMHSSRSSFGSGAQSAIHFSDRLSRMAWPVKVDQLASSSW